MRAWRTNSAGLLVPTSGQSTWPRPAGWEQLPPAIRAEWDRRWAQAQAGAR